jgi:hypothetical protein
MVDFLLYCDTLDGQGFTFDDLTPNFDAINYPNGLGGVNPNRANITAVTATLTDRNATEFTIDLFDNYEFILTRKRATVTSEEYTGVPTFSVIDGCYNVVFSITNDFSGVDEVQEVNRTVLISWNMKCLLSRLCQSDPEEYKLKKAIYDRVIFAFECENTSLVNELVETFFAEEEDCDC